jgi:hypothetical protein
MAIDGKYGRVTTEHGTIGEDEPVVVFRAQDRLLPRLLKIYFYFCDLAGSPTHHLHGIDRAVAAVKAWQADNPTKTPSSDTLAGGGPAAAPRILDLPLGDNDAGAATVRDYLIKLLGEVWKDGEGFSGKRPFGNSGWEYELYRPLVAAGLVDGELDEQGYISDVDDTAADQLIAAAIRELGGTP